MTVEFVGPATLVYPASCAVDIVGRDQATTLEERLYSIEIVDVFGLDGVEEDDIDRLGTETFRQSG